jgi:hypothetical protein
MTWFGKILTFVVMLASVVWMYFTVQAYVTRTNWQTRASALEASLKDTNAAREAEQRRNQSSEAALKSLLSTAETRAGGLSKENETLKATAAKSAAELSTLQETIAKGDITAKLAQANVASTQAELKAVRERNETLENTQVALVLAAENAKKEEVKARNNARLAQQIADDNARRVEELTTRVTELRNTGGSAQAQVERSLNKPPPPVLAGLRGEVTDAAGELLTVSVGIDAGLAVGTVLDVVRVETGTYLGTAKVTSALNLFPKQAIMTFTPKNRNVSPDRLPAGELPKKGDQVQAPNATSGGR